MLLAELSPAHVAQVIAAGFGVGIGLIAAIGAQNAYILRTGIRGGHLLAVVITCMVSDVVIIAIAVGGIGALQDSVPWLMTALRWFGVAFLTAYGLLALWRAIRPRGQGLTFEDSDIASTGDATQHVSSERAGRRGDDGSGIDRRLPAEHTNVHPSTETDPTQPLPEDPPRHGANEEPDLLTADDATLRPTVSGLRTAPIAVSRPGRQRLFDRVSPRFAAVLTALALTWLNPHVYVDLAMLGSVANTYGDPGRWLFGGGVLVASVTWFSLIGFGAKLASRWLASPTSWRILDAVIAAVMLGIAASLAFV